MDYVKLGLGLLKAWNALTRAWQATLQFLSIREAKQAGRAEAVNEGKAAAEKEELAADQAGQKAKQAATADPLAPDEFMRQP